MALQLATYRLAARILSRIPLGRKWRASVAGRRGAVAHWLARSRAAPRPGRVAWFHAASVGEALVAEPVIRRLRSALDHVHVVLTYSSPSLAGWPRPLDIDAMGFAPPEEPGAVAAVFEAIGPDLLVFSRSDLWPEMLLAAGERGVPVAVIGATVRPGSGRLRWPARHFLKRLTPGIRFVGAVTIEDAQRWAALGATQPAVVVTGDPRHDQVLDRVTNVSTVQPLIAWAARGPTLVAGSVEEADERVVLEGVARAAGDFPGARVLIVPHDPSRSVSDRIARRARRLGLTPEVLLPGGEPGGNCVIVLERGGLADLYSLGTVSYVGGGFRRGGLHAVIEPAAYALPLIVGPYFSRSSDAARIVAAGGATALPRRGAGDALGAQWGNWLRDGEGRVRAGLAARNSLYRGAAATTARHLLSLLTR